MSHFGGGGVSLQLLTLVTQFHGPMASEKWGNWKLDWDIMYTYACHVLLIGEVKVVHFLLEGV